MLAISRVNYSVNPSLRLRLSQFHLPSDCKFRGTRSCHVLEGLRGFLGDRCDRQLLQHAWVFVCRFNPPRRTPDSRDRRWRVEKKVLEAKISEFAQANRDCLKS